MKKNLFILFVSLFFVQNLFAASYYVSNNGNDLNSGRNKQHPIKSIQRLNQFRLAPGDCVFFERGSVFSGEITVPFSGKKNRPIVYSSYGMGVNPVITGAVRLIPDGSENGLARYSSHRPVSFLYCNVMMQPIARYPNSGYLPIGEGMGKSAFKSPLHQKDGYWQGATIKMRTIDWVFERNKIKSYEGGVFTFEKPSIYDIKSGYGYFLEGKKELIDSVGEWAREGNKVLRKSLSSKEDLDGVVYGTGVRILPGVHHIIIENLCIRRYAIHDIHIENGASDIIIRNNHISDAEVNGIQMDLECRNVKVWNNHIRDCRGRGISGMRLKACSIKNNEVRKIGIWPGYGISGVNGMVGIVIEIDDVRNETRHPENNYIGYNLVDSTGYAGIRMDGSHGVCERNIVKNTSLKLNDSGAIYSFAYHKNYTFGNIFRDNLVINAVGNVEATPSNGMATNGIYVDNNSTDNLVENNTIVNVSSAGIVVNDASPRNTLRHNVIYNADRGIQFAEWAHIDSIYSCTTDGNVIVCKTKEQIPLSLINWLSNDLKPGTFDNDIFVNPHDGSVVEKKIIPEKGIRRQDLYNLSQWQRIGNDIHGKVINGVNPMLIYNDTFAVKPVDLRNKQYMDIDGNTMDTIVNLEPCKSILIFKKNEK